jgi:LmbE family N-acetylglucosaminyl deacetylase
LAEQLSLMGIYAHPDDEQGISGSILKYSRMGANTTLICATRGEAGEIAPDTNATPENLGQVREQEMRCAAELIGVNHLYFLDYRDSGMAGTPENEHLLCLHQAPLFEVAEKVTRIVRRECPQVILTFDAFGGYGHPDHIQMHKAALIAFFVAGDPRAYSHQLAEDGVSVWTPQKLYFGAFSRARFQAYYELMRQEGKELDEFAKAFEKRALPEEAITTRIDVSEFVDLKMQSLMCHATQLGPNTFFAKLPRAAWREGAKNETFVLAESRSGRPDGVETDLFAGLM